jgi:hypothetical protein
MTREQQQKILRKAYDMLTEAHDLILDVHIYREGVGEIISGDAIAGSRVKLSEIITALRNSGDVDGYFPDWERPN